MKPPPAVELAFLSALSVAAAGPGLADEIVISGIPLTGVVVRGVERCEVQYTMAGRLTARSIDRIALHLDDVPALGKAEARAALGDLDQAMTLLDEAASQAKHPWHRTWIHYRRTRLLDAAGRYTQACHAWATLLLTGAEPCWADSMPTCPPDQPDPQTHAQALAQLRRARESAGEGSIAAGLLDSALESLAMIKPADAARQPRPDPDGQTDDPQREAPQDQRQARPPSRVIAAGPPLADEIDRMLDAGQAVVARREIEMLVAAPGGYPLDRLLHQYGRVLAMQGQPRDAAVRFMQCAILFEQGPHAASSLFETARLYAGPLADGRTARRLLDRAAHLAAARGEDVLVERINAALAELNSRR